jgi:hypothetical protein
VTSAYSINLATGAAALLLPTGGPSAGLALGDSPAGAVAFLPPIGGDGTIVVTEGGTATINLIRTGGSVGTVTVQVVQTGGTAVAGLDYNGLPATVTFADGQTTATIVLTLPNDSTADGTKTLILGFNNPTNGVVFAAPSAQNVTIQDASNPLLVGYKEFGVGQDTGGTQATLYRQDQSVGFTTTPFAGFTGGVRTAVGDVNGDGVGDLIVATGPGSTGRVIILDGVTQAQLFSVNPFEASFTGGLFVAVGDINADGIADIVVTPDQTGGPRVVVFLGGTFTLFASFFGIDDPNFRGGARAAVADVNGDGFGDIIVAAGFGGGPRVALFSGATVGTSAPTKLLPDFFVFEQTLRNGVFVAGGDVTGDGFADMMFGGGPGGGPRVLIVDGAGALTAGGVDLAANPGLVLTNFFAGDPNNRGGIRLAAKNLDNDGLADLVTGSGTGAGSQVTTYLGSVLGSGGSTFNTLFPAFPGFNGGIFVG